MTGAWWEPSLKLLSFYPAFYMEASLLDEGTAADFAHQLSSLRNKEIEPEATDELKQRLSVPERLRVSPLEFINQRSTNEFIEGKGQHLKSHPTGIANMWSSTIADADDPSTAIASLTIWDRGNTTGYPNVPEYNRNGQRAPGQFNAVFSLPDGRVSAKLNGSGPPPMRNVRISNKFHSPPNHY